MSEAKTALVGYLRIKDEYGLTLADKYLDAIPENAVDQIADLTAKLAGVMGALEDLAKEANRITFSPNTGTSGSSAASYQRGEADSAETLGRMADKAIADEPPASKRYRAIVAAAEALQVLLDGEDVPGFIDVEDEILAVVKAVRIGRGSDGRGFRPNWY